MITFSNYRGLLSLTLAPHSVVVNKLTPLTYALCHINLVAIKTFYLMIAH